MTIFGIDLSDFDSDRGNNPLKVAQYRAAGISFVTHKSVETDAPGSVTEHTRMGGVLTAAKSSGVPFIGAYVVVRSGASVAVQGQNHIAFLDRQIPWWREFPGFFHQVDLERWDYDHVAAWVGNGLFDWLKVNGGGKSVVLYASEGQYGSTELRYPRWNANYPGGSGDFRSLYASVGGDVGPGWTTYGNPARLPEIWQYSSSGVVAGQGTTDVNAFRGTEAEFAAMLGAAPTEEDDMINQTDFECLIWRVAALIGDTPVVTGGACKGELNKMFRGKALVQGAGKSAAWLVDGTTHTRYWIQTPADLDKRVAQYGAVIPVKDVTVFGPVSGVDPGNV